MMRIKVFFLTNEILPENTHSSNETNYAVDIGDIKGKPKVRFLCKFLLLFLYKFLFHFYER